MDAEEFAKIRTGDRVTILVHNGLTRNRETDIYEPEYKRAEGRAVMRSATGGWVLNTGGRYGTPGLADPENTVAVRRRGRKEKR